MLLGRVRIRLGWDTFVPIGYWAATYIIRIVFTTIVRWHVTGRGHVPKSGGIIVVCNHLNNADPPILGAAIAKRRIRFMAKSEIFGYPLGIFPRLYGAFPVRRFESDVRALLKTERMLRNGEAIGIFPEGTRSRTGQMGKVHPGAALVALRTGATVIPCAITGTETLTNPLRLMLRPQLTVSIGPPLKFEARRRPSDQDIRTASARILTAIKEQLPSKYRPTYTDLDDNNREPQLNSN